MKQHGFTSALPANAAAQLGSLGKNIRQARILRGLTQEDLAAKALTTRETLRRLERGSPGVALGTLAHILWALGLDQNLPSVASIENDIQGKALLARRLPRSARKRKSDEDIYDF